MSPMNLMGGLFSSSLHLGEERPVCDGDVGRLNADEALASSLVWRHQDDGWHLHVVFWVSS